MKNLKSILPIIAILYAVNTFYYAVIKAVINENSYLRHIIQNMADGYFRFIDVHFFRTLMIYLLIGIFAIGVLKYYNSEEKKINKFLEFGLIYQAITTLFHFPSTIHTYFGGNEIGASSPHFYWYIQYPVFLVAAIITCIYFSRQIKTFQRAPFGEREKSYGSTPYEKYLDSGKVSVSSMLRFKNYLLDGVFIYIIAFSGVTQLITTYFGHNALGSNSTLAFRLILIVAIFFYYFLMEAIFGKTLGKIITGSAVQFYGKSSFVGALGRTFCRMIPFEPFSFFSNKGYGWHDKFSGTTVEKLTISTDEENDLDNLSTHLIES